MVVVAVVLVERLMAREKGGKSFAFAPLCKIKLRDRYLRQRGLARAK